MDWSLWSRCEGFGFEGSCLGCCVSGFGLRVEAYNVKTCQTRFGEMHFGMASLDFRV